MTSARVAVFLEWWALHRLRRTKDFRSVHLSSHLNQDASAFATSRRPKVNPEHTTLQHERHLSATFRRLHFPNTFFRLTYLFLAIVPFGLGEELRHDTWVVGRTNLIMCPLNRLQLWLLKNLFVKFFNSPTSHANGLNSSGLYFVGCLKCSAMHHLLEENERH